MRRSLVLSLMAILLEQTALLLLPAILLWCLLFLLGISGTIAMIVALTIAAILWGLLFAAATADRQ